MKRSSNAMGKRIAVWCGVQILGLLLLCGLMGAAVMAEWVRPETSRTLVMVLGAAVVFSCCWLSARSAPRQRLTASLLTAAIPAAAGMAAKLISFGDFPLNGKYLLVVLGTAAAAGIFASRKKTRKR